MLCFVIDCSTFYCPYRQKWTHLDPLACSCSLSQCSGSAFGFPKDYPLGSRIDQLQTGQKACSRGVDARQSCIRSFGAAGSQAEYASFLWLAISTLQQTSHTCKVIACSSGNRSWQQVAAAGHDSSRTRQQPAATREYTPDSSQQVHQSAACTVPTRLEC